MIFEEDDSSMLMQLKNTENIEDNKIVISDNNPGNKLKFEAIVKFFNRLSAARGLKKSTYVKEFIRTLFKNNRNPHFTYSIIRLILPADDRDRGNYGVKQKALAKIVSQALGLQKKDYQRLYHYKNPNYHDKGVGIGDFSICLYDVIRSLCNESSNLTVEVLNQLLDQLASSTNQVNTFRKLIQLSNAEQIKWITRIILKDLKLGIKIETVLNTFHSDGNDYFNLTNSIAQTCKKFENPKTSLNDDVELFHPIRPMLAGKKKIEYFKYQNRSFFCEIKYDGQRLQMHIQKDKVKLFSRNGVDYNHVYQEFLSILPGQIQADACILDGQVIVLELNSNGCKMMPFGLNKVVALGNQGQQDQDQNKLQLCYKIFDILWLKKDNDDLNMMGYPLRERKKILEKVIKQKQGRVELVKWKQITQYEDVLKQFNGSIQRNQQGIMLKDPNSIYGPKQRGSNWIKLKGDYVEGLTDTLDLLIIGGYYGDQSYRLGDGSHWTDQITCFLVSVIDRIDELNPKIAYVTPFARIGTGYNKQQLKILRDKLRHNLVINDGRNKPHFLQQNWKYSISNKPDCWVNSLQNSYVLQIKAAEIIKSDNFPTGLTLRFPRVVKIRYDKDWNQAMNSTQLQTMMNQAVYTKGMKRKNDDNTDSQQQKDAHQLDNTKKKRKQDNKKQKKNKNIIMDTFLPVDLSTKEILKSHLFTDQQFVVLPIENCQYNKHQIQKEILLNDGHITQNPLSTTKYIVSNQIDFRLQAYLKSGKNFIFIKPKYVFNCVKAQQILPLSPLYLTILPKGNAKYYMQNFDKFGDSYTAYLNRRQLDEVLAQMSIDYPINQRLISEISLHYPRQDKRSLAIGLDDLSNKFVNSLIEQPNSIIIGCDNISNQMKLEIENYTFRRQGIIIQNKQQLRHIITL